MIVVDINNNVLGSGPSIKRVNAQGEENLIKVCKTNNPDQDFFFIGTEDRDQCIIINGIDVPDSTKNWKYVDGQFEEVIYPPTKKW